MKRTRTNRLNIEWRYAGQCFNALRAGQDQPPVPSYSIWEKDDESTKPEKLIGTQQITPQRVSYGGRVWF